MIMLLTEVDSKSGILDWENEDLGFRYVKFEVLAEHPDRAQEPRTREIKR